MFPEGIGDVGVTVQTDHRTAIYGIYKKSFLYIDKILELISTYSKIESVVVWQ